MKVVPKPSVSVSGFRPFVFLKEVRSELDKVDWPTREQAFKLTLIVIVASVTTAVYLGFFDFFFTKLTEIILGR